MRTQMAVLELPPMNVKLKRLSCLLYFQKALLEEQYELCRKWANYARYYGASNSEIKRIVRNPLEHLEEH